MMPNTFLHPLLVALGGALGALSRYGLGLLASRLAGHFVSFPLMTLLINVGGSFALGLLTALVGRGVLPPEARLLLGVGFLGAYTTFSTFSVDTDGLLLRGEYGKAALYLGGNVGLGVAAALLGRLCGLRLGG